MGAFKFLDEKVGAFLFTDALSRAAKPKEKEYKLAAGEGLYLFVRPNGRKFWKLKYRYVGKEQKLSQGALWICHFLAGRTKLGQMPKPLQCCFTRYGVESAPILSKAKFAQCS